MHIGLIGGIGVAATIVYYKHLSAAVSAAGGVLDLTIVHADVQELILNNLSDNRTAQAPVFARLIDRLKDAGCDCAAVTSLGGHFCIQETNALSSLPLVSAIAPLDAYFAEQGIKRIGLLGTRSVMKSGLFGQLQTTLPICLSDALDDLGQTYQDMAVNGFCTDAQRDVMVGAGRRLINENGADAVLLAGTDLNLAFDGRDVGYRVIDALDVHVQVLTDLAIGRTALDDVAMPSVG
jgi:aspartate racemase